MSPVLPRKKKGGVSRFGHGAVLTRKKKGDGSRFRYGPFWFEKGGSLVSALAPDLTKKWRRCPVLAQKEEKRNLTWQGGSKFEKINLNSPKSNLKEK